MEQICRLELTACWKCQFCELSRACGLYLEVWSWLLSCTYLQLFTKHQAHRFMSAAVHSYLLFYIFLWNAHFMMNVIPSGFVTYCTESLEMIIVMWLMSPLWWTILGSVCWVSLYHGSGGYLQHRGRFDPRPAYVVFLVDKVALGQVFLRVFWYLLLSVLFH